MSIIGPPIKVRGPPAIRRAGPNWKSRSARPARPLQKLRNVTVALSFKTFLQSVWAPPSLPSLHSSSHFQTLSPSAHLSLFFTLLHSFKSSCWISTTSLLLLPFSQPLQCFFTWLHRSSHRPQVLAKHVRFLTILSRDSCCIVSDNMWHFWNISAYGPRSSASATFLAVLVCADRNFVWLLFRHWDHFDDRNHDQTPWCILHSHIVFRLCASSLCCCMHTEWGSLWQSELNIFEPRAPQ